jgi:hypothetical protein
MEVEAAAAFFGHMFGRILATTDYQICIWSLPSKAASFFRSAEDAADHAGQLSAGGADVYFGVSALCATPQDGQRGNLAHMGAIGGLWADLDIAGEGEHKKPNLPPTQEDAFKVLDMLKVEPSIIIHSGHGLQCYWLFAEPWIFRDEADRQRAADFSRGWNATLQFCARKLGYSLDAVHDLTRVMRVPGTVNHKNPDNPLPVTIIDPEDLSAEPYRRSLDKLDMFMVPAELTRPDLKLIEIADAVTPEENAALSDLITVACENDSRFKKTWERRRADLKDQSPSGYDFSLVNQLVQLGASDQEIANALFIWRKKHGEDPRKVLRRDYLMRTISRARTDAGAVNALSRIEAQFTAPPADEDEAEKKRQAVMADISKAWGVDILSVTKHGAERSIYSFKLASGRDVVIGGMMRLLNQDTVRIALGDATGIIIKAVKRDVWHRIVQSLLAVAEFIDNPESERAEQMRGYLAGYFDEYPPVRESAGHAEQFVAFRSSLPFIRGGQVHVAADHILQFIRLRIMEKFERAEIWDLFRLTGFRAERVNMRDPQDKTKSFCRSWWVNHTQAAGLDGAPAQVLQVAGGEELPF